eukprot:scaffold88396_cov33-Tisochrysis_lutea.AAC.1
MVSPSKRILSVLRTVECAPSHPIRNLQRTVDRTPSPRRAKCVHLASLVELPIEVLGEVLLRLPLLLRPQALSRKVGVSLRVDSEDKLDPAISPLLTIGSQTLVEREASEKARCRLLLIDDVCRQKLECTVVGDRALGLGGRRGESVDEKHAHAAIYQADCRSETHGPRAHHEHVHLVIRHPPPISAPLSTPSFHPSLRLFLLSSLFLLFDLPARLPLTHPLPPPPFYSLSSDSHSFSLSLSCSVPLPPSLCCSIPSASHPIRSLSLSQISPPAPPADRQQRQ